MASAPAAPDGDDVPVVLSPATGYPALKETDLEVLRGIGKRWGAALGDRAEWIKALPCDPNLGQSDGPATAPTQVGHPGTTRLGGRRTRFVPVEADGQPGEELEATREAGHAPTRGGWTSSRARRALLGPPLHSAAVLEERMRKLIALPVLSSDALSSVAYGPEAMLVVLALGGATAFGFSVPISIAVVVLMVVVGLSYRQTIRAYPRGGGSYIVASDNLGLLPGLIAAAGLMLDYILTVAVSVASGIAAITSAIPSLAPDRVPLGLAVIAILVAGNLRGVRQAGLLFAAPTYMFIFGILLMVVVGVVDAGGHGFHATPRPPVHAAEGVGLLLILRAFGSGATAMTGIEAISDGIPAFRPVEWRNARTTLTWMVSLLVVMFVGTIALIELDGIVPQSSQTVLSQLAHRNLGSGALYGYVQAATALVLLLAANTAFSDFPRLLFFLARDYSAPRLFLRMGDRLAFSNGIVVLGAAAAAILAAFDGSVTSLIPLFAVGVFLAFTLSQSGMVKRWLRTREPGWKGSICFNALGAFLSGIVLADHRLHEVPRGRVAGGDPDPAARYPVFADPQALPRRGARGGAAAARREGARAEHHAAAQRSRRTGSWGEHRDERPERARGGARSGAQPHRGADHRHGPRLAARARLRRLARPAGAGAAHLRRRGGGQALSLLLAGVGRPRAAGDRALSLPCAGRALGSLPAPAARPGAPLHDHRRAPRTGAPPPLAPRPAQRHRPPPAPRAAPAAGDRDHHCSVSPAELIAPS